MRTRSIPTGALPRVSLGGAARRALAGCAALAAAACSDALVPLPLPPGARPFVPEPVFRAWWAQMEACSGQTAPFDRVTWYVVPGEEPFRVPNHAQPVLGYWDPADNRIVLLQFLPVRRAPTVRHEALHAITRTLDHPPALFRDKCGATIDGPENPEMLADEHSALVGASGTRRIR